MAEGMLSLQPANGVVRGARRILAGLAAMLLIAGCSGVVPKGNGPKTPTATPGPVDQPIGDLPEDQRRHRIALLVPLTGADAGVGQSIADAATMAVLDANTDKIRITTYDTAPGAALAAQKALADGNKLILGPLLAEDVAAVAPLARRANVPLLSFSNDTTVAGNGTYILGFTPSQSIQRVVSYARSRGLSTFAALVPNGRYGDRATDEFRAAVTASGGRLLTIQNYDRTQRSINSAITKLQASGSYDALMIADSGGVAIETAPIVRRRGGARARLLGTELWNNEARITGAAALRGAWFASVSDGLYNSFVNKFRARYQRAPYRLASLGYDAVLLVIRVARDWRPTTAFPVRVLSDPGGFGGVDGAFRFGASGVAERSLEIQQVDAGMLTILSPAPSSFKP